MGTRAAVGGGRRAAAAGGSLVSWLLHEAWGAAEEVVGLADRLFSTGLALLLLGATTALRLAERSTRAVAAAAASAAGARAERLSSGRQAEAVRRLGPRAAGVTMVPGPAKHLMLTSAARALLAAGQSGSAGALAPSSGAGSGSRLQDATSEAAPAVVPQQQLQHPASGGGGLLPLLMALPVMALAAAAAAVDVWAWRVRQLLVHVWLLTIGRTTYGGGALTSQQQQQQQQRPRAQVPAAAVGTSAYPPASGAAAAAVPSPLAPYAAAAPAGPYEAPAGPYESQKVHAGPAATFAAGLAALGTATRAGLTLKRAPETGELYDNHGTADVDAEAEQARDRERQRSGALQGGAPEGGRAERAEGPERHHHHRGGVAGTVLGALGLRALARDRQEEREEGSAREREAAREAELAQQREREAQIGEGAPAAVEPAVHGGTEALRRSNAATRSEALAVAPAAGALGPGQARARGSADVEPEDLVARGRFVGYTSAAPEARHGHHHRHHGDGGQEGGGAGGGGGGLTGLVSKLTGGALGGGGGNGRDARDQQRPPGGGGGGGGIAGVQYDKLHHGGKVQHSGGMDVYERGGGADQREV